MPKDQTQQQEAMIEVTLNSILNGLHKFYTTPNGREYPKYALTPSEAKTQLIQMVKEIVGSDEPEPEIYGDGHTEWGDGHRAGANDSKEEARERARKYGLEL